MSGKKGRKKALHLSLEKWNSHRQEVSERKEAFSFKWQISLLSKTNWQDVVFIPSTEVPFPGTICVSTNRFPQHTLKNLVIYCFVVSATAAGSSFYMRVVIWTTASSCEVPLPSAREDSVLLPSAVGNAASQASLPSFQGCQPDPADTVAVRIPTHSSSGLVKKPAGVTKRLQAKQT